MVADPPHLVIVTRYGGQDRLITAFRKTALPITLMNTDQLPR